MKLKSKRWGDDYVKFTSTVLLIFPIKVITQHKALAFPFTYIPAPRLPIDWKLKAVYSADPTDWDDVVVDKIALDIDLAQTEG